MVSTKSKARPYNYGAKPEPTTSAMERAKRLPNPGPGLAVTVPLSCEPEWLELHGLEVADGVKLAANQPLVLIVVRRKKQDGLAVE